MPKDTQDPLFWCMKGKAFSNMLIPFTTDSSALLTWCRHVSKACVLCGWKQVQICVKWEMDLLEMLFEKLYSNAVWQMACKHFIKPRHNQAWALITWLRIRCKNLSSVRDHQRIFHAVTPPRIYIFSTAKILAFKFFPIIKARLSQEIHFPARLKRPSQS